MSCQKQVVFHGDSLNQIRAFPEAAKRRVGYQIALVQSGQLPNKWRPMPDIGSGVAEIKVSCHDGAFRVFFVANVCDEIHILHAFQKKTRKTEKKDIDLARQRLKELKA